MPELTYQDVKLGERAVEAYKQGKSPIWIAENLPTYLNTRHIYAGLNTTDLVLSAVLGGINGFLMGEKGTGKSQIVEDIAQYCFGGKVSEGESFITEAHNEFELEPLFIKFNQNTGEKELRGTHRAVFYTIEELTRAHATVQNQFYSFGNGRLMMNGFDEPLGREGYSCAFATGNDPRNEKNIGTFESDEAFLSRFALILDLQDRNYRMTEEDEFWVGKIKPPMPGIVTGKKGENLTDKIISANKEIIRGSLDLGLEAEAVFSYLSRGLRKCPGLVKGSKTEKPAEKTDINWPYPCITECERKGRLMKTSPLCRLVREPDMRILNSARRYASALNYVARLKNSEQETDPVELAFLAFELTGAYQNVLNEQVLQTDFSNRNNTMMREVVDALKRDFRANEDYIVSTLKLAGEGREVIAFYESDGQVSFTDTEAEKRIKEAIAKKKFPEHKMPKRETPQAFFTDKREVGLGWVNKEAELIKKNRKYFQNHKTKKAETLEHRQSDD